MSEQPNRLTTEDLAAIETLCNDAAEGHGIWRDQAPWRKCRKLLAELAAVTAERDEARAHVRLGACEVERLALALGQSEGRVEAWHDPQERLAELDNENQRLRSALVAIEREVRPHPGIAWLGTIASTALTPPALAGKEATP
jgi:hypothetical protein